MATTNYGLPTFNGAEADKPIQFKSTITQGFQKIDEVMKNNADAAAPVADLTTVVHQLNDRMPSTAKFLPIVNSDNGMIITLNHMPSDAVKWCAYNGVNLRVVFEGVITETVPSNGVIASVKLTEGDITNIPDNLICSISCRVRESTMETGFTWGYTRKNGTSIDIYCVPELGYPYYGLITCDATFIADFGLTNKMATPLPNIPEEVQF